MKKQRQSRDMDSWISSLAKQATETSTQIRSKEERKQKRAAKLARRQERRQTPVEEPTSPPPATVSTKNHHELSKERLRQLVKIWSQLQKAHRKDKRPLLNRDCQLPPVKRKRRPLNETTVQPRPSDYSGIGLARESLYIPFQDPSHMAKLEEEFKEHIPGFFGRQRTKAMKRQLDGNMLWRKLAAQKEKGKLPKKLAQLSPDERVQAMLDAGML